ncbi:NmrA family NAD(P)-binding protein [Mucilaginibacter gynuensis]|uniref:NmrA family NAD(P)-binding protein n=1 Tax=Mucilaginibacter gynuensis TaxID=1302236 RepID=A0ABP8FWU9_9SPHI
MKIVLTGSISNVGKPLTAELVKQGHDVTVITSKTERQKDIVALGAKPAVGSIFDADFLADTFTGAEIVYLMETLDAVGGDMMDPTVDFIGGISEIGNNYRSAIERSGVKQVVHLSSIGAHTDKGNGFLIFHHNVESILKQLPENVSIKFMRPVGFYTNLFAFVHTIKTKGKIISNNNGGDRKEPWVSPLDIAAVIAEEMNTPFAGRTVRYIASDEVSPNEVAAALGDAIGRPGLKWEAISDEEQLNIYLKIGFNPQIAKGFVEMQASQGSGLLYEDYYQHKPVLGKVKLADFARDFAAAYQQEQ